MKHSPNRFGAARRSAVVISLSFLCLLGFGCKAQERDAAGVAGSVSVTKGEIPPPFELMDIQGRPITLETYRGKVVLLNFWATWCAPCVAEMPALERLYQLLKDDGLEIVAINLDAASKDDLVRNFTEQKGLTFTVLRDPLFGTPRRYGVTGFPESIFVGRDGRFTEFKDPQGALSAVRIISDRPWDAPAYVDAMKEVLKR